MIDVSESLDKINQVNIRKLYCDVYSSSISRGCDSYMASRQASNSVADYINVFKPELKKLSPKRG